MNSPEGLILQRNSGRRAPSDEPRRLRLILPGTGVLCRSLWCELVGTFVQTSHLRNHRPSFDAHERATEQLRDRVGSAIRADGNAAHLRKPRHRGQVG